MKKTIKTLTALFVVVTITFSVMFNFVACVVNDDETEIEIETVSSIYINYMLDKGINSPDNPEEYLGGTLNLSEPIKTGYKFTGWFDSEQEDANCIDTLSDLNENITLYARWEYDEEYFGQLPVISVSTNDFPILNKTDYVNASFEIFNTVDGSFDLSVDMQENYGDPDSVGIRLRGNYTMHQVKKPYRIKFAEKTSFFGLEANKSWVLLADYLDPTSLRNYSALTLGKNFDNMDFVNSANHVVLYLNGEYKGLYLLTEQVDENEGRTGVKVDKSYFKEQQKEFPFLIEMDRNALYEGITGIDNFEVEGNIDYVYPIEIKYPDYSEETFEYIKEYMTAVFLTLSSGESVSFREGLVSFEDLVDVNSFIDFYLLNEIMHNKDAYFGSVKLHKTVDGLLQFGPVWDFDFSACDWTGGIFYTTNDLFDEFVVNRSVFRYFIETSEGFELVQNRFNELKEEVKDYIVNINEYQNKIYNVVVKDALFWYGNNAETIIETEFKNYKLFLYDRLFYLDKVLNYSHNDFLELIN